MSLLHSIEQFCARHAMAETSFGRAVIKDGSFVARLRAGRSPTLRTVEKCEKFMEKHDKPKKRKTESLDHESLG